MIQVARALTTIRVIQMKDKDKAKEQLIDELVEMRQ